MNDRRKTFLNRFVLYLLLMLASFISLAQSNSDTENDNGRDRFEVGQELIFSGRLDRYKLGEIFAIKNDKEVFVDLASFINVLDFPILPSNQDRMFDGWFSKEENTFSLRVKSDNTLEVIVKGQKQNVAPSDYTIAFDSLYIDTASLTAWFDIAFEFDYIKLEMRYLPAEPLPVQRKLARQSRRVYKGNNRGIQFPELARGYEILSPQLIDLFTSASYFGNADKVSTIYSAIGTREIAQHNVRFSLNGSDGNIFRDGVMSVSKISKDRGLLGFLKASRYEFGDITPIQIGNLGTSNRSVGIRLQNTDSSQRLNRQTTSINGDVQIGWDVELFRNGVLLDQIFDLQQNRYEFNDIDLVFGKNVFEIVLYGPQGQIVRETKTEVVDDTSVGSDDFAYQFSLVRLNSSITSQDIASELDNSIVASLSLGQNISETTSLTFGLQRALDSDDKDFVSLGLNTRLFDNVIVGTNLTSNLNTFVALGNSLRTTIGRQSVKLNASVTQREAQDEQPEVTAYSMGLNLSGQFDFIGLDFLSYNNEIGFNENGSTSNSFIRNALTLSTPIGSLFHNISYQKQSQNLGIDASPNTLKGGIGYQGSLGPFFTRVSANYDATNEFEFGGMSVSLTWNPLPNIKSRLLYSRDLNTDVENYNLNVSWRNEEFSLGGQMRYSEGGGYSLGLNTRMSFGGVPYDRQVFATGQALAASGSIAVRVFEDKNGNAEFDLGETLLPNMEVQSGSNRTKVLTDGTGIALIHNLSTLRPTDISVENKNQDNPFMLHVVEGVSIQPRSGFIDRLDFPMVKISEIEGTIYFPSEIQKPAAFAKLLLKKNQRVVRIVDVEFDGYFLVDQVPPGRYTLELEPQYAKNREFKPHLANPIDITNESQVIIMDDIVIQQQTYKDAFIVNLGRYSNPSFAHAQALLFRARLSALNLTQTIEVLQLEVDDEKYVVSAAVVRSAQTAQKYCKFMELKSIDCSTLDYRMQTSH